MVFVHIAHKSQGRGDKISSTIDNSYVCTQRYVHREKQKKLQILHWGFEISLRFAFFFLNDKYERDVGIFITQLKVFTLGNAVSKIIA